MYLCCTFVGSTGSGEDAAESCIHMRDGQKFPAIVVGDDQVTLLGYLLLSLGAAWMPRGSHVGRYTNVSDETLRYRQQQRYEPQ